jgi:hypothetical protein
MLPTPLSRLTPTHPAAARFYLFRVSSLAHFSPTSKRGGVTQHIFFYRQSAPCFAWRRKASPSDQRVIS